MNDATDLHIGPRAIKQYIDRRMMPVVSDIGITPSCWPFLKAVYNREGVSLKELTSELYVDKSLTTRNIKVLIDDCFMTNEGSSKEYHLYLTDKGREAVKVIDGATCKLWTELMSDFTPEEREVLKTIMSKFKAIIEREFMEGQQ